MLALMLVLVATAYAQEEPIDWRDAASCVGQVCSIRGTVALTDNDGAAIRLYFDPERRDVRVLLMRGWLVTWPQYDGQTIVATGKVGRFRDHVEVTVLDPSKVVVVGGASLPTPTEPGPSPPTPSPAAPSPTQIQSSPTQIASSPTQVPSSPTQIPSSPTLAPPPTQPPPPSPPASEVEELRQRVRELEQRVRELEGR